ncbi:MAG: pantoate--beta-alanine ligase, partial [Chitinophagales bacterium]|nr:pantoate--beta-alanine ligase [Chitinophagales bacterium]
KSKYVNDITVCCIYVNTTKFNDPKDLEKYPRPIVKDIEFLLTAECDILYLPSTIDIYPNGINQLKKFDLGFLENFLEGASRPGHFNGVANVVERLLRIVNPLRLYLGQKDFQQVKVVEKMLSTTDLKSQIIMCPIVREQDGLAMSSRNERLTVSQIRNAAGISDQLFFIQKNRKNFTVAQLKDMATTKINSLTETKVDYLDFCDAASFQLINDWNDAKQVVCVTAVIACDVRLLDNILIS